MIVAGSPPRRRYASSLLPLRNHVLGWLAAGFSLEPRRPLAAVFHQASVESWSLWGMGFQHFSSFAGEQVGVKPEAAGC